MSTPSAEPKKPRRRRGWLLIPLTLLGLLLAVGVWAYVRGSSAESTPRDPDRVEQRPLSQVVKTPEGHTTVRAAILLDVPRDRAWKLVTDFANYHRLLPYLKDIEAEPTDGGATRLSGLAQSALPGYWAFTLDAHAEKKEPAWRVWWDETGAGPVLLNRGGWTLREPSEGQTLLVLELEAVVKGYPTWVLRNFFLYRLRQVLEAVKARLAEKE